jgi:hypothetical protein
MQTDIYFLLKGGGGGTTRIVPNILGAAKHNFAPSFVKMTDKTNINFTAEANNRFSKQISSLLQLNYLSYKNDAIINLTAQIVHLQ